MILNRGGCQIFKVLATCSKALSKTVFSSVFCVHARDKNMVGVIDVFLCYLYGVKL